MSHGPWSSPRELGAPTRNFLFAQLNAWDALASLRLSSSVVRIEPVVILAEGRQGQPLLVSCFGLPCTANSLVTKHKRQGTRQDRCDGPGGVPRGWVAARGVSRGQHGSREGGPTKTSWRSRSFHRARNVRLECRT